MPCPTTGGLSADKNPDVIENDIPAFHCIIHKEHISLNAEMENAHNNNNWCVYILRCRNSYLYTGMTNNLHKRMSAHEKGSGSKFVRSHSPFELLKVIYCSDEKEARKLEYSLKKLKRRDKFTELGLEYCALLK